MDEVPDHASTDAARAARPAVTSTAAPTSRDMRSDDEWVRALSSATRDRDGAINDLYALLHRAAHSELRRRTAATGLTGAEVDDLAQQAAADATVAVLRKIDTFRGESRFTTWAYAFVVFEVSAVAGRHLRKNAGVLLDVAQWEALPDRWGTGPADQVHGRELLALLRRTVEEQLTERQRQVFVAIVVDGVPLDAVVADLGTNRNAVYKTIFDARRKIREVFVAHGYLTSIDDTSAKGGPAT